MDPFDRLRIAASCRQSVDDVDTFDDQDLVLEFDLAGDVRGQPLDLDLARSQRADERPGQSAARRGDDVVERRRVFLELSRQDAVMFRDRSMKAEAHRLLFARQPGEPYRPSLPFDSNV